MVVEGIKRGVQEGIGEGEKMSYSFRHRGVDYIISDATEREIHFLHKREQAEARILELMQEHYDKQSWWYKLWNDRPDHYFMDEVHSCI